MKLRILALQKKINVSALIFLFLFFLFNIQTNNSFANTLDDARLSDIPTFSEVQNRISEINDDKGLGDAEKKEKLKRLENIKTFLTKLDMLKKQNKDLNERIKNSELELNKLTEIYQNTEQKFDKIPEISNLNSNDVEKILDKAKAEFSNIQKEYSNASDEVNNLQTLPERAQTTITQNQNSIKKIQDNENITGSPQNIEDLSNNVEIYVLTFENNLLQTQMSSLTTLQNIADLYNKIAKIKLNFYNNYVSALQSRQNEILSGAVDKDVSSTYEESKSLSVKTTPKLAKVEEHNKKLLENINDSKQRNIQLNNDSHEVISALTQVRQMKKSLDDQLSALNRSLVLSRLLNKAQSIIPNVKLKYDLDETIPKLNLWLYELKEMRDSLFNIEETVNDIIKTDPSLEVHREQIVEFTKKRLQLCNDLYQEIANELNASIALKLNYDELNKLRNSIKSEITEKLFWIPSNQPLNIDFVKTSLPYISYEISNIYSKLKSDDFIQDTQITIIWLVPAILLALLVLALRKDIKNYLDRLASRLDRKNDTLWITPLSILITAFKVIPSIVWRLIVGAICVILLLGKSEEQVQVISMLLLHIAFFVFFINIFNPNELAQRHFSIPPQKLEKNRLFIARIWNLVIPILVVANITEIDSSKIYYDILGYLIIILCSLALIYLAITWAKDKYIAEGLSASLIIVTVVSILVPLIIIVMMVTGYYYTTAKLINRTAFTFYTLLFYWLLKNLALRSLYLIDNRMARKRLEILKMEKKKSATVRKVKRALRFDFIGTKTFKLINAILITFTVCLMYWQWNDLASVLSYLKTINLLDTTSLVDGKTIITDTISLADVLLALLILGISVMLNKNLPALLERFFLIKSNNIQKSTGYTVRIVSSYAITALGIIFAAGTVGVKWENLQWLVAALSVGLGFGLQEIFANFVSGLIILLERQIRVGDIITLSDMSGTVSKIRIRATTITSFENKEVMIPNRQFITSALTNWSLSNTVTKLEFIVGVAYGADVDKAKSLLRQIIGRCPYISKTRQALVNIQSLADSSINILCEVYVDEIGKRKATNDYLCSETLRIFDQNNIEIPFNQMEVKIKNLDKEQFLSDLKKN